MLAESQMLWLERRTDPDVSLVLWSLIAATLFAHTAAQYLCRP